MQLSQLRTYEYKRVRLFVLTQFLLAFVFMRFALIYLTRQAFMPYARELDEELQKRMHTPGADLMEIMVKMSRFSLMTQSIPFAAVIVALLLMIVGPPLFGRTAKRERWIAVGLIIAFYAMLLVYGILTR